MDLQFINYFMKLIQKALEWLQEMWKEAGRTGFPPFSFMPEKEAIDWTTAHREPPEKWDDKRIRLEYQRMLTRNRVRRWRERQKEADASTVHATVTTCEKNAVTCDGSERVTDGNGVTAYGNGNTVTGNAKNVTCNAVVTECNANAANGNASVTPCNASAKKEKENEKRKKQRKELKKNKKTKTNIADAMPNSAREGNAPAVTETEHGNSGDIMAAVTQNNEIGNGNNAFVTAIQTTETGDENTTTAPQPEKKKTELIPTANLPEAFRKVVLAWNKLPLDMKLSGLYPFLLKRLRYLFENYGEEQIHKAIESIANSPFLLGKSKNNRGWVVSFSWMMNPENLEKVLEGQYLDKAVANCGARLFQPGDELLPLPEGFIGTVVY